MDLIVDGYDVYYGARSITYEVLIDRYYEWFYLKSNLQFDVFFFQIERGIISQLALADEQGFLTKNCSVHLKVNVTNKPSYLSLLSSSKFWFFLPSGKPSECIGWTKCANFEWTWEKECLVGSVTSSNNPRGHLWKGEEEGNRFAQDGSPTVVLLN